jgi:hypothetical protein
MGGTWGQSIWDKMWCYLWEQFEDHMGTPRKGGVSFLNFVRAHSKNMMQTSKSPKK